VLRVAGDANAEGQSSPTEPHQESKTQMMWLGSAQQLAKVDVSELPVAYRHRFFSQQTNK